MTQGLRIYEAKEEINYSIKVTLTSDPLDEEAVKKLDGY